MFIRKRYTLEKIAKAQVEAGLLPEAFGMVADTDDVFFKAFALFEVASAQAKAELKKQATQTMAEALAAVRNISGSQSRMSALREIAAAQSKMGLAEDVRQTTAEMLRSPARKPVHSVRSPRLAQKENKFRSLDTPPPPDENSRIPVFFAPAVLDHRRITS